MLLELGWWCSIWRNTIFFILNVAIWILSFFHKNVVILNTISCCSCRCLFIEEYHSYFCDLNYFYFFSSNLPLFVYFLAAHHLAKIRYKLWDKQKPVRYPGYDIDTDSNLRKIIYNFFLIAKNFINHENGKEYKWYYFHNLERSISGTGG